MFIMTIIQLIHSDVQGNLLNLLMPFLYDLAIVAGNRKDVYSMTESTLV
jgi:hypothetical protein